MKATGIIRRLDELGRIVIPKEIRKTLRINEGDSVEIFTDDEQSVVVKKFSPIDEFIPYSGEYANSLATVSKSMVVITDKDRVVAATGAVKKEVINREISNNLLKAINEREMFVSSNLNKSINLINDGKGNMSGYQQLIQPIISDGEAVGAVILLIGDNTPVTEVEKKLASVAALFIANQIR